MVSNFLGVIRIFPALIIFTGKPEYLCRSKVAEVLPKRYVAATLATLPKVRPAASMGFFSFILFVAFFIPILKFLLLIFIFMSRNQKFSTGQVLYKFYDCHFCSIRFTGRKLCNSGITPLTVLVFRREYFEK